MPVTIKSNANGTGAIEVNGNPALTFDDKGAVGGALPFSFRNKLINGNFDFWQRATSQTASGYHSDDRWANGNVGSTKTASQQSFALGQTDVPNNPRFFSRTVVTSAAAAGNYVIKQQRIEGVRTLAGKKVTVSFYAKADAARPMAIDFNQYFGTGGTPSAAVSAIGAQKFNLTTAWQKFTATVDLPSIAGKTIGTDGNDFMEFTFWFDAGTNWAARSASLGQQSGTFDIAQVQVEEGSAATEFEDRPLVIELGLCWRFYQVASIRSVVVQSNYVGLNIPRRTHMRRNPTVTFSDATGAATRFSVNGANGLTVAGGGVGQHAALHIVDAVLNSVPAGATWWLINEYANAEL